jgi:hypothetical protein
MVEIDHRAFDLSTRFWLPVMMIVLSFENDVIGWLQGPAFPDRFSWQGSVFVSGEKFRLFYSALRSLLEGAGQR